jgi:hypothetical protein
MFEKILQLLAISCRHKNTSQPFAAAVASATVPSGEWETVGSGPGHYVVCLDCGKKFAYDWANMRMMR